MRVMMHFFAAAQKKIKEIAHRSMSVRMNTTQIAVFAKTLALMLRSGIPIGEALTISQEVTSGGLRRILDDLVRTVRSGNLFSSSLAAYPGVFSQFFVSTVKVGEAAGTLPESLDIVAQELMKHHALVVKIRTALIYPVIILVASFILGIIMSVFILPKLLPLLSLFRVDMPLPTRILFWFATLMKNHGTIVIGGTVGLSVSCVVLVRQKFAKPFTHLIALKTPIIRKMVRAFNVSRLCRTLSTMITSGIGIDAALAIMADATENVYYRRAVVSAAERISKGTKLSASIGADHTLFPVLMTRMIRTGEESGKLSEIFLYLADFYEEELDNTVKTLSATLEPLLLLFLGGIVVFLALAIITPIFKITGSIGN